MSEFDSSNFNNVFNEIIKKSLFTRRQIEIILNYKNLIPNEFDISKGAYFRQVSQSRNKLRGLYYSIILLDSLGVLLPDDIDVMVRLSEQISAIKNRDVASDVEDQIINVIDQTINRVSS